MSDESQSKLVENYTRTASGLGVVLGPGVDAAPLLATWVAGFIHLARDNDITIDEQFAESFVGTIFVEFVQWYISENIAQVVVAAIAGAAFSAAVGTAGIGAIMDVVAPYSSNTLISKTLINALFTYKFLTSASTLLKDPSRTRSPVPESAGASILQQLTDVSNIGDDLANALKILFSGLF
jgi:hypothetical protein